MSDKPNPPLKFWSELKRRNVFRVVAMYAGAAFVAIELTNNVVEPLGLPDWIPAIVILIIIIGFPITAILSWIFDITPQGLRKTGPIGSLGENSVPQNNGRRKLKSSDIVITVLIIAVVVLLYPKIFNSDSFKKVRDVDGKISIAVLPFENLSGDTLYNVWKGGFQNLLINTLSNSKELTVRNYQAVNDVLGKYNDVSFASLSPSLAEDLSRKLEIKTLVLGNILKAGNKIRINAQIVNAETEEIYQTYQAEGKSEDDAFAMVDSISGLIKNYIEIENISNKYNSQGIDGNSLTNSSEAFKYFINGLDAFNFIELGSAVDWFSKAIEADSSFISAYVYLSYANLMRGNDRLAKYWSNTAYKKRDNLPVKEKLILDQLNAYFFETPYDEIRYLKQLIEIDKFAPNFWHQLGFAHYKLFEYEDAILSWEQVLKMNEVWGTNFSNPYLYFLMGDAYHKVNRHDKEESILALGRSIFPTAIYILEYQAICALSQGDIDEAEAILSDYKSIRRNVIFCTEAMISTGMGKIYSGANLMDKAEYYYRKAIQDEPDNLNWVNDLAWFLIDNEIDIEEGLDLVEEVLEVAPEYWPSLDIKGWGLYRQGKVEESLKLLNDSWVFRPAYVHTGFLHIQEVEQAFEKMNSEE